MGLFSFLKQSNTLYFPGCVTYFKYKDNFELYKKIFNKLGIDCKTIKKNICCGLPAFELGYDSDARKLARRNFEIFKEENISKIITNSPCCYKMFKEDYPKLLPDWNIEVLDIWKLILAKIGARPSLIKDVQKGVVAYNDSCYLGRYSKIYDEPRKILELIGFEVKEMQNHKSEAMCSGCCGSLYITNPKLANNISKERIMQAKRLGIKKIIVLSMEEYQLLSKNVESFGVEILELSEVLGLALGIKKTHIIDKDESDEYSSDIGYEEPKDADDLVNDAYLKQNKLKNEKILSNAKDDLVLEQELKEEDW